MVTKTKSDTLETFVSFAGVDGLKEQNAKMVMNVLYPSQDGGCLFPDQKSCHVSKEECYLL